MKRKGQLDTVCKLIGKIIYTSALFLMAALNGNSQTNIFPSTGKVGIGTLSPTFSLDILAPAVTPGSERFFKARVSDAAEDSFDLSNATNATGTFVPSLRGRVTSINNSALFIIGEIDSAMDNGSTPVLMFSSRYISSPVVSRPLYGWTNYSTRLMTMLANGNLGIGIVNPAEKLAVKGKIRAQEVKVEMANWADFVFAKDYVLPTLRETEKHIKEKGHLPGIPSAAEVEKNGIELGDMNKKLLQKIEELTLHLIKMNKTVEDQSSELSQQKEQINQLRKTIH